MLPRLIFILFTIAFITYTWFHTGKAKSHAVNDPRGACKCIATWICTDKETGNETVSEAMFSPLMYEDECLDYEQQEFCSNDCPKAGGSEEQKKALCPGGSNLNPGCKHTCSCKWDLAIN